MSKKYLFSVLFLAILSAGPVHAQSEELYQIIGVVDVPAFSGKLHATVTDTNGRVIADSVFTHTAFRIDVPDPSEYTLVLETDGYQDVVCNASPTINKPIAELGIIRMEAIQQIEGITVAAEKTFVRNTPGGFVYDVLGDPDSGKLNMNEFFGKVPGIWTDQSKGKIIYEDNRKYIILIDGKKHMMISGSRQYAMTRIRADHMKTIEVMDPAPPEWADEADVVIDIRLAKELPNGIVGSIDPEITTLGDYYADADLTYKHLDLTLNINYFLAGYDSPKLGNTTDRESNSGDESRYYHSRSSSQGYGLSHIIRLGASYDINSKNSVAFSFNTKKSEDSSHFRSTAENRLGDDILDGYRNHNNTRTAVSPKFNGAFTYFHSMKDGKISLSYSVSQSESNTDYIKKQEFFFPEEKVVESILNDNTSSVSHNASVIFSKTLSPKHSITGNTYYTHRHYSSLSGNGTTVSTSEGIDYTQQIGAAYASYSYRNRHFSLSAQLRGEYVSNKGKFIAGRNAPLNHSEFNFLPRLNMSYMLKNTDRLQFMFLKYVMRPNLNYLNPFVNDSDPQNITVGEPGLRSERSYSFNLSYRHSMFGKKLVLMPKAGIQYIDRAVEKYKYVSEDNISTTTYRNLGHRVNYQAGFSVTYSLNEKIRFSESFSYQWSRFRIPESGISTNRGYYNNLSIDASPWKEGFIIGSISVSSRPVEAQDRKVSTSYSCRFGVSQAIVKNSLYLTVWIIEPFRNHSYVTTETTGNGFTSHSVQEKTGRSLSFNIRWMFGRLKDRVKEAGAGISNDDLSRK